MAVNGMKIEVTEKDEKRCKSYRKNRKWARKNKERKLKWERDGETERQTKKRKLENNRRVRKWKKGESDSESEKGEKKVNWHIN